MSRLLNRRLAPIAVVALALLLAVPAIAAPKKKGDAAKTVTSVELLGEVDIASGTLFDGTIVGGLSSITYDRGRGVYYAVSDDQGNHDSGNPVRYYTIDIDVGDGTFGEGDVTIVGVDPLYENKKSLFDTFGLDPEGLVLAREGQLYLSSEGVLGADPIIDPFIRRYNTQGRVTAEMPIPDKYLPNGVDWGVRSNLGFESLNMTPNGRMLVTANEDALFQDGPKAAPTNGSLARVLAFDARKRLPVSEFVYEVEPVFEPSPIGAFTVNGIDELMPIDNAGTMLVMERSFSVAGPAGGGSGNYVELFEASTVGASDVLGLDALYEGGSPVAFTPMSKRSVFVFNDALDWVDNIEGMTFGPDLPDGRKTLVFVSDDNFSDFGPQKTQFIVLAVDIEDAG